MIDLLILDKKTMLIKETNIPIKMEYEPEIRRFSTDPVLFSMRKKDYTISLPHPIFNMNSERLLIKFFGYYPSLFNKIVLSGDHKELECLNS